MLRKTGAAQHGIGTRAQMVARGIAARTIDGLVRSGRARRWFVVPGRYSFAGAALITCRTSMGMFSGAPPGPGAAEAFAAISRARSGVSTSTIQ